MISYKKTKELITRFHTKQFNILISCIQSKKHSQTIFLMHINPVTILYIHTNSAIPHTIYKKNPKRSKISIGVPSLYTMITAYIYMPTATIDRISSSRPPCQSLTSHKSQLQPLPCYCYCY